MKRAIIYVHGKGGSAVEAEHYKTICRGYDIFGFDYKGITPWDTKDEFLNEYDELSKKYDSISIIANSIGAYFTMNSLQGKIIDRAFFISPIVNLEKLITDMMMWSNVSESELYQKGNIETNFGETLSWEYLQYVRNNPIKWTIPTEILYGGKDHLVSRETIQIFAEVNNAHLIVMENGEHWFHTDEQMLFLDKWIKSIL